MCLLREKPERHELIARLRSRLESRRGNKTIPSEASVVKDWKATEKPKEPFFGETYEGKAETTCFNVSYLVIFNYSGIP